MKNIFHDLLNHFILFTNLSLLILQLSSQLLIFKLHLVESLFKSYLLLIQPLFIRIFQAIRNIRLKVEILLGFLVSEIRNALKFLGRPPINLKKVINKIQKDLHLVSGSRLRSRFLSGESSGAKGWSLDYGLLLLNHGV